MQLQFQMHVYIKCHIYKNHLFIVNGLIKALQILYIFSLETSLLYCFILYCSFSFNC